MQLVELVDENGRHQGSLEKIAAHEAPGRLHRAFSVFLVDDFGRILLQKRAATKYHWPNTWSNSCCGHPSRAETVVEDAVRRVYEELRIQADSARQVGLVSYRFEDHQTGLVEHEYNHVIVAHYTQPAEWNPDEVAAIQAVEPSELAAWLEDKNVTGWFWDVFRVFADHISHQK
ncbi:isopentenyl-diphosphate delta-isomerase [Cryobacterium psychrophilum]|uniref:Isopentenyl-diphosphate Delta-isomerase n=1 Tax=Cryobacterium psychrophilum TaxID=41988 RepID=A0A4Y8KI25_9MICO|nr:isopentenyl-diphosphate Delta-isomerase [Cryobacterium psychrophilum]TDW28407.1 isopentenyl-diphosphate delta-isomerase [Cryobacterium psychrophilum]TFD75090.1 isopentenyl-diphosphate Delta-isomerase [Cryobacterium psychrophilum]